MSQDYAALHAAMTALAARCDGAQAKDGQGFNAHDTVPGKRMAAMPVSAWTQEIAAWTASILPTYKTQLLSMGIDLDSIPELEMSIILDSDMSVTARDQARQYEKRVKNAPYIDLVNGEIRVLNSYPIKNDLKSAGFNFSPGTKSWDAPVSRKAYETLQHVGVSLTDYQRVILSALPAGNQGENLNSPAITSASNIRACELHPEHLVLDVPFGSVPLTVIRAIPGRKWDADRRVNCISPNIYLYTLAEKFSLTISDDARAMIEIARAENEAEIAAKEASISASKATDTTREIQLSEHLYPYQKAGVDYALSHQNSLGEFSAIIGDAPGLGKTRQGIVAAVNAGAFPLLIVCPNGLVRNWEAEINRIIPGKNIFIPAGRGNGFIPEAEIYIIGWSNIHSWVSSLPMLKGLIFDEGHYMKEPKSQRTKAILRITGRTPVITDKKITGVMPGKMLPNSLILDLTGTPVLNRTVELVEPLVALGYLRHGKFINPDAQMTTFEFKQKFCGAVQSRFGTAYNGSTNTEQLHMWLRETCMVRREKMDVLRDLPSKLVAPMFIQLSEAAKAVYLKLAREGAEKAAKSRAEAIVYLNALRGAVGTAKIGAAVEWADDFLQSGQSLVIFAIHKNVQQGIVNGLREKGHKVGSILGGMTTETIESVKAQFERREIQVIVMSFTAHREGHTLTTAHDMLIVEQGWNPGTQEQAEDRIHRIGQTEPVTVWYLICQDREETVDLWMYELISGKREITDMVNSGIRAEQSEESVFSTVLERALDTYGGR
jgi:hypothetical protein